MTFFVLEPEVAGGFGPDTTLDRSVHPPRPIVFNYEFDGWLGDPIVETVASFIVTLPLKEKLERAHASGIKFGDVVVTTSDEFEVFHPNEVLPKFVWMQVLGSPGHDDFGLSADHRLVVSERMLELLKAAGMAHCDIGPFT
jgi:hypothetical protein